MGSVVNLRHAPDMPHQQPNPDQAKRARRSFGKIRKLPSGRWQASYVAPDGRRHNAPTTFDYKGDAAAWLSMQSAAITEHRWKPPEPTITEITLVAYAGPWLAGRTLQPRTRDLYQGLLDQKILPDLGDVPLKAISPLTVRTWHAKLDPEHPTRRAHAYALLRTILGTAVADGLIPSNPCVIRGAGQTKREHKIEPATPEQLDSIISELPERYGCLVLLGTWCAMRWGELVELRRKDLDWRAGKIRVRRSAQPVDGVMVVGPPKSAAGVRDVAIPPHLLPVLRQHVNQHAGWGPEGLVFPADGDQTKHLSHGSFYKPWKAARAAAGRPDLRFHDLRHTGAVMAAQTGATLAELMGRLGHSTPAMAIRYQHVAQDRDTEIARRLSEMASGK